MKLLVDECIGKRIHDHVASILALCQPPIECVHLLEFTQRQGEADEVWIPRAAEQRMIIVTGDSGRGKYGAPLHLLAPKYGVTGVYFSGKLCQRSGADKGRAILSVFPERWQTVASAVPGSRFRIQMTAAGFGLKAWPLPA